MTYDEFNEILWDYYAKNARDTLPWRIREQNGEFDAYKIIVSEIMLQQTQVGRVIPKYAEWLTLFPTVQVLAAAPLADVLVAWSGLGYNRRAKFLHEAAKQIVQKHGGVVPKTQTELIGLPGIGVNTAGAVLAYAYNQPAIFIETNVRTAFLYYFYPNVGDVPDSEITKLVSQAIDTENPREWYWALMDMGTYIKKTYGNFAKNSKHHVKQSTFKGSNREIRGKIIKILVAQGALPFTELSKEITDSRLAKVLAVMQNEGLITRGKGIISLAQ